MSSRCALFAARSNAGEQCPGRRIAGRKRLFTGLVDTTVSEQVGEHLLAVLREGLTNASKYAGGSHYLVRVGVDDRVTLEIADDGIGFDPASVRSDVFTLHLNCVHVWPVQQALPAR